MLGLFGLPFVAVGFSIEYAATHGMAVDADAPDWVIAVFGLPFLMGGAICVLVGGSTLLFRPALAERVIYLGLGPIISVFLAAMATLGWYALFGAKAEDLSSKMTDTSIEARIIFGVVAAPVTLLAFVFLVSTLLIFTRVPIMGIGKMIGKLNWKASGPGQKPPDGQKRRE
ncbi:hypothetical protein HYR69_11935 [Candidatus Sumerlaeota bacterium]|nr:hypothetical protein [Candidatus Sumerlaeota bacterium]